MKCHLIWTLALAILAGGCASSNSRKQLAAENASKILPPLLAALTGPDALLLTNADGIQGRLTLILNSDPDHLRRISGQLFESKGRLYFASEPEGKNEADRFSLIWDTLTNKGFIMSEALQGIAPISVTNTFSALAPEPLADTADAQDGHPVQIVSVTFDGSNGQIVKYKAWQAEDINHLSLRIEPLDASELVSLTLSKIEKVSIPEELFLPPDGFTKYASSDALLDELMARQHEVFNNDNQFRGTPGLIDKVQQDQQSHPPTPSY